MPITQFRDVHRGAQVGIVLKQDQPTGREVHGVVQDVLTRKNHPRGIKVRLADGRVGRIQRFVSSGGGGGDGAVDDGGDATTTGGVMQAGGGGGRGGRGAGSSFSRPPPPRAQHPRYRDVRLDEPDEAPAEQVDLAAYIKPAKQRKGKGGKKGGGGGGGDAGVAASSSLGGGGGGGGGDDMMATTAADDNGVGGADAPPPLATCPVCNAFEGDEAAVAHHVQGHFD